MILSTEQIIKVLNDLEKKFDYDLEDLKYEVLNNLISYENTKNIIWAKNDLKEYKKINIKLKNEKQVDDIYKIEYNKSNKYYMLIDTKNNLEKIRNKEATIDLEITIGDLLKKINI
jgi:hypothetical protein